MADLSRSAQPQHGAGPLGRVLVIDDDANMRHMIVTYLGEHGCQAVGVADGDAARQQLEGRTFSLVVVDVQLGRQDGFDVLRRIRERSDVPVIMITGQRHDEIDGVVGLELGADDYVAKPFNLRELLARARATLRRQELVAF
jgi:two-component system, OmpR family, response regulator